LRIICVGAWVLAALFCGTALADGTDEPILGLDDMTTEGRESRRMVASSSSKAPVKVTETRSRRSAARKHRVASRARQSAPARVAGYANLRNAVERLAGQVAAGREESREQYRKLNRRLDSVQELGQMNRESILAIADTQQKQGQSLGKIYDAVEDANDHLRNLRPTVNTLNQRMSGFNYNLLWAVVLLIAAMFLVAVLSALFQRRTAVVEHRERVRRTHEVRTESS
jgi:uncharacterized protein YukE